MPRYYFDLRDPGSLFPDEEGMELRDLRAAREEAARTLGDMARDAIPTTAPIQQMTIEVRDDSGAVMHVRVSLEIEEGLDNAPHGQAAPDFENLRNVIRCGRVGW